MSNRKMITFSGIDSAGKSTYIDLLKSHLDSKGMKYKVIWSRGGYTDVFEFIKKVVRLLANGKLPSSGHSTHRDSLFQKKSVSNLWYVIGVLDLIRLYSITFRLYSLFGYTLICDRYIWDTYVDFTLQFSEDKLRKSFLWRTLEHLHRVPDISFFFYVSANESLKRSIEKKEAFSESLERRELRLSIYHKLNNEGHWSNSISTESDSIEDVWENVKVVIENAIH